MELGTRSTVRGEVLLTTWCVACTPCKTVVGALMSAKAFRSTNDDVLAVLCVSQAMIVRLPADTGQLQLHIEYLRRVVREVGLPSIYIATMQNVIKTNHYHDCYDQSDPLCK